MKNDANTFVSRKKWNKALITTTALDIAQIYRNSRYLLELH